MEAHAGEAAAQATYAGAAGERPAGRWRDAVLLTTFTGATFTAAGLVFLVQPIAARMVLPLFGGASAVWVTAMVFFQALLLAGYAFAYGSIRVLGTRRQPLLQILVLLAALATLPIGRHLTAPDADASPALWLLGVLTLSVGAPYFVVTTAGPTLQRWFSTSRHRAASDPYFLYAASNAGSLLALLAYPFLVEPHLSLSAQADLWSLGYVLFAGLSLACLLLLRGASADQPALAGRRAEAPLAARTRIRWIFMASVPSCLLVGVTTYLSTDVAAVPLLWVAPLSVYLLTFVIAFSRRRPLSPRTASAGLVLLTPAAVLILLGVLTAPLWASVGLHLIILLAAGVLIHGRLADERPAPERLTEFYLLLSLGGVLGGAFAALVAPVAFDSVVEYQLALVAALLLRSSHTQVRRMQLARVLDAAFPLGLFVVVAVLVHAGVAAGLAIGLAACSLVLVARRPARFALGAAVLLLLGVAGSTALHQERTFFGVLRVLEVARGHYGLEHGTTLHGVQRRGPGGSREPLSYFHRKGPIGEVFRALEARPSFDRVAVIGLGVGSLAAYGSTGQKFTFYEIDPAVVRIASDDRYFTFLRDTRADVSIVVGDGRRSVDAEPNGVNDLLVVDAFSSDAIPVHLVTREAVELYVRKLAPGGVVALHITNRHLDLSPVVAAIADDLDLAAAERVDDVTAREQADWKLPSHWVVIARSREQLYRLPPGWQPLRAGGARAWTDDYSNILGVLK